MTRQRYNTRQRGVISALMGSCSDRYLSVDEVCELLRARGEAVGRTTVYRTLERLAAEGCVAKVSGIRGEAAQYRGVPVADDADAVGPMGQLRCERCGRAFPLDCDMLQSFVHHVSHEHGFLVDQRRTVIYGVCAACQAAEVAAAEGEGAAAGTAATTVVGDECAAPAPDHAGCSAHPGDGGCCRG
ncbi:Zinc uptake regulation protein [Collinsella sp. AK_207A]|uniref:Fur family transcriptional regulator n=1 Tax=Collinsella sp. AK_207A TaxID=2650472 RepID=UPI001260FBA1|nr:transcriptional repressor [Collinsella sp. AK_207A]VWL95889.1 Zinc uptake regulation protein [Collinsella sp. AK_207A]